MRSLARLGVAALALTCGAAVATHADGPPAAVQTTHAPLLSPAGEGRRLWLKLNCYGCHGLHAQGGGIAIPVQGRGFLVGPATHGAFHDFGMPIFSAYVTDTDVQNLSAYLSVAGTPDEPTFLDWWVASPQH